MLGVFLSGGVGARRVLVVIESSGKAFRCSCFLLRVIGYDSEHGNMQSFFSLLQDSVQDP